MKIPQIEIDAFFKTIEKHGVKAGVLYKGGEIIQTFGAYQQAWDLYSIAKLLTALVFFKIKDQATLSKFNNLGEAFKTEISQITVSKEKNINSNHSYEICSNWSKKNYQSLLNMRLGQVRPALFSQERKDLTNQEANFLNFCLTQKFKEGEPTFLYTNVCFYLLAYLIERESQESLEVLLKKYFPDIDWNLLKIVQDFEGHSIGASEMKLDTLNLAKLGNLLICDYQNKANEFLKATLHDYASDTITINLDKQDFIKRAKTLGIEVKENELKAMQSAYANALYQDNNGILYANGSYGQCLFLNPDKNLVLAINSEKGDNEIILYLAWKFFKSL